MKEISFTDIKGLLVGHAQDEKAGTGCTVVLCEKGCMPGMDLRGGAPATRETAVLSPLNRCEAVHAVVLSGGSAYGLDACAGVMEYLEERGVGFDVGVAVVPIVCGASLLDLGVGSPSVRPDRKMGYAACLAAGSSPVAEGNVGAGTGASVGKICGYGRAMKSGLGVYGLQAGELQVAAIAAVNAWGDILDPSTGKRIAGVLNEEKNAVSSTDDILCERLSPAQDAFTGNTTLVCVATNAALTKPQACRVATMSHDGFARAVSPIHSTRDGDAVFTLATGEIPAEPDAVGALAARVVREAIVRGVKAASPAYGLPAYRSL